MKNIERHELPEDPSFPYERYEPLALLGYGATGAVYKCMDKVLTRTVAVKTLKTLSQTQIMDFHREARVLSTIRHPGIVSILDFGVTEKGHPYLVMECVEGETLEDMLKREGSLPTGAALEIFAQVTDALAYAHSKGVFHRDVKPTNILLQKNQTEPQVKLIDFGIAAIIGADNTQAAQGKTIVGTPQYMSPDQVKGETYNSASEVYTVCCVLFETIAGAPPFKGDSPLELFSQHANKPVPSLLEFDTPSIVFARLDEVIRQRGLAKHRKDRFTTMQELHQEILTLIDECQFYESGDTTYGDKQIISTPSPERAKQLQAINVRYTLVFITCLVAVISIVPVIAFAVLNQANDESRKSKVRIKKALFAPSMRDIEDELNRDSIVINRNSCRINGNFRPGQLKKRLENSQVTQLYCLGVTLTDERARAIAEFEATRLELIDCTHDTEVFEQLKNMHSLKALVVNYGELSDDSMSHISQLPDLMSLDIRATSATDGGLAQLANHRNLQELSLRSCKFINGSSLRSGFQKLKVLRFGNSGIHGGDLSFLKSMPKLRIVDCLPIDITDDEMVQFRNLPIERLKIGGPNLTAKGLQHLLAMRNLKEVETPTTRKFSVDNANQLRRSKPQLTLTLIEHPNGSFDPEM